MADKDYVARLKGFVRGKTITAEPCLIFWPRTPNHGFSWM
jgi:hypothetical protein